MEYCTCHPLLQFTEAEMTSHRKLSGMSNVNQLRLDIESIMEWFNKQPHLAGAGIEKDTVERMMLQAKGSIERTKERIEKLYSLKTATPELMAGRDTHSEDIDGFWSWSRNLTMPKLYNGQRVTILQVKCDTSKTFEYNMLYKVGFMVGDLRLKHDYSIADIYVVDLANTNFSHLARVNPYIMRKADALFTGGYGSRISGIHVLNAPSFADRLLTLMKQTIKPKITDRIVVHSSLEDLHRHVPREYLPSDYDGFGKSLDELAEMWRAEFRSEKTRQFFLDSEKRVSDESARINAAPSEQLAGSFRKLELD